MSADLSLPVMAETDARRLTEKIRESFRDLNQAGAELSALRSRMPREVSAHGRNLYLMQMGDDGPVKIGVANDVEARRRTLQTAAPHPLHIRVVLNGRGHREREMHQRFAYFRMSGEWFEPIPEIFDWFRMEAI